MSRSKTTKWNSTAKPGKKGLGVEQNYRKAENTIDDEEAAGLSNR